MLLFACIKTIDYITNFKNCRKCISTLLTAYDAMFMELLSNEKRIGGIRNEIAGGR
jgi:hypothetical protein